MTFLGVLASLLAFIVVAVTTIVVIGVVRLRRVRNDFASRVAALGEAELSTQANLFGLASAGTRQTRGPGTLLLTADELAFVQLLPAREMRLKRDAITSTRASRHFLGKTQARDLLVVTWDVDGLADAAAFDVADVEPWCTRLS